jgi:hypothetical protein
MVSRLKEFYSIRYPGMFKVKIISWKYDNWFDFVNRGTALARPVHTRNTGVYECAEYDPNLSD